MTESPQSFSKALREADAELRAIGVPSASAARIRRRLAARTSKRSRQSSRLMWCGLAVFAAAMVLLFASNTPKRKRAAVAPPLVAGFHIETGNLAFVYSTIPNHLMLDRGPFEAVHEQLGVRISGNGPVSIHAVAHGLVLLDGTAQIRVMRRNPTQPRLLIETSYGRVETRGTVLTLSQTRAGGHLTVSEGSLRFIVPGAQTRLVVPGDTIEWP